MEQAIKFILLCATANSIFSLAKISVVDAHLELFPKHFRSKNSTTNSATPGDFTPIDRRVSELVSSNMTDSHNTYKKVHIPFIKTKTDSQNWTGNKGIFGSLKSKIKNLFGGGESNKGHQFIINM